MRNKYSKLLFIFFTFISFSLISGSGFTSHAKVSSKKVHKAYEKSIQKANKKWQKFFSGMSSYPRGFSYFTYYDLNKDGIDECFMIFERDLNEKSLVSSGGTDVAVFTYYKGKVRKLVYNMTTVGGTGGGIFFDKKSGYIDYYDRSGWTDNSDTFKVIQKGKLVEKGTSEYHVDMDTFNSTGKTVAEYKVNGKTVSKKKYDTYRRKLLGKELGRGLTLYRVTNSNLRKFR